MDVHAAARLIGEGLGHEGPFQPMLLRDRLDEPFVHDRVVAGAQRVGLVAEREFELARSEFGDRAFEREVLDVDRGVKRVEEGTEIFEFAQAINLDIARRSEEHTSELQLLMCTSYAVFCLKQKSTSYKYNQ